MKLNDRFQNKRGDTLEYIGDAEHRKQFYFCSFDGKESGIYTVPSYDVEWLLKLGRWEAI